MKFTGFIVVDAEEDLFEIYKHVFLHSSPRKAKILLNKLKNQCNSLAEVPQRSHIPLELKRIGVFDYMEIHCFVYRIIYQIRESEVYINCVLDGRRDLQEILEQRLLR